MEIPFKDIYDYINNNLSKENMLKVKKTLIEQDEMDVVYHSMMFDYQYNQNYIESLIGVDDEEIKKSWEKNVRIREKSSLKNKQEENYQLKQREIMETVNGFNLPKNMEEIGKAVKELEPMINEALGANREDLKEHGKEILAGRYPELSEKTLQKIVDDLYEGVTLFDTQFEALKANAQEHAKSFVEKLLNGKTDEEKKNLLANSLIALSALKDGNASEETIDQWKKIYEKKELHELISEFEQSIAAGESFEAIVNIMEVGLQDKDSLSKEQLDDLQKQLQANTKQNKFYTALMLYIAHCEGKLDLSFDEEGIDIKMIGASAAAAVTGMHVTALYQTGLLDKPTWMKWMKWILGGLFVVAILVATIALCAIIGIGAVTLLMSMFGQGIIATLLALIIACYIINYVGGKVLEGGFWLLDKLEEPYDKLVDKITTFVQKLIKKIKRPASHQTKTTETTTQQEKLQKPETNLQTEENRELDLNLC